MLMFMPAMSVLFHWPDSTVVAAVYPWDSPWTGAAGVILPTMAVTDDYVQYVIEQLAGLGRVTARRMFGGVGLYHEERFFGLIAGDTLYLKVNDSNRGDYEARGMGRFRPYPNKPQLSMNYYEVPADTLEDADECVAWARKSLDAAAAAAKRALAKPPPRRGKERGR